MDLNQFAIHTAVIRVGLDRGSMPCVIKHNAVTFATLLEISVNKLTHYSKIVRKITELVP